MTTFDSVMAQQHPYTSDSSFEDFNGYSSYKPTSPHTGFSPTMGNQEISALLDAFTGTSGDDYGSSLFTQQQPNAYFQSSNNYETFNPAWTMGTDSTPSSFGQSTNSGYSPKSSLLSSDSQRPTGATDGFRISQPQQNPNSFDTSNSMYASTESFPSAHRPTSQTVPYLEAIAAAPSSAMSMSYSQSQPEQMPFNPHSSHLARQDSTRSFLEGPHLSGLTLDSPRNSVSAGSSGHSSSQNSPTTPLSAYATDLNLSFQGQQQQKYLSQSQAAQQGQPQYQQQQQQQTNFIPYVNGAYQARPNYVAGNALSMSVPASMSRTGYEQPAWTQLQSSARPHGRMSSAGLMDQIVSSRQVLASPVPEQMMEQSNQAVPVKEKKGLRSRASSRSSKSKTSPTPPATPGRSGLRQSKHGVDATQLHTILSGHTTPTAASPVGNRQAPSSAGPHRTPSKRTLSYESVPQQAATPAATTPRRPSTLRRTASHTPGSTLDNTFDTSGLASPADLQASHRAQNAAQFAMASAMAPAQKARIAASANLEFPGGASGGMSRAQSSPGYALSGSYSQQQVAPLQTPVSPSNPNDQAKRRSNTLSSLHMSPMAASPRRGSDPAYSPSHTVSFAEALLALDQITSFLNYQSSIMTPFSDQSTDNVLGTYDQLQHIEDLKRRVHNKLAFPS